MNVFLPLLTITVAEAAIGVFVKLVGGEIPIMSLNFYRMFFAAIFLASVMPFFYKNFWKFPKKNFTDTLIIGVLIAAQISVFNFALSLVPIANAVVFWSISPFFAFIFSWLFINEKPKKEYIFIFIIAIIGIIIAQPLKEGVMIGNLAALGSGAIYAALITYMRREGKTEKYSDIFWSFLFGALILLPGLITSGFGNLWTMSQDGLFGLHAPVIIWAIALGVISTGFVYFLITNVIKKIEANTYSLIDTIGSPIVAALLGYLIFSEVPSMNMIYGGALLIISGYWLTKRMEKTSPVPVRK